MTGWPHPPGPGPRCRPADAPNVGVAVCSLALVAVALLPCAALAAEMNLFETLGYPLTGISASCSSGCTNNPGVGLDDNVLSCYSEKFDKEVRSWTVDLGRSYKVLKVYASRGGLDDKDMKEHDLVIGNTDCGRFDQNQQPWSILACTVTSRYVTVQRRQLKAEPFTICEIQVIVEGCPAGSYNTGSTCAACPSGHYCLVNFFPDDARTPCPAGRYVDDPATGCADCGAPTKYSPGTVDACSDVSTGYYTTGGTETTRTAQVQCEKGFFCTNGARSQCSAGTYGSVKGLSDPRCSGFCTAGYYCTAGSQSPTQNECGGADKYCGTGSAGPATVGAGQYSTPTDAPATRREGVADCPAGYWCSGGVLNECAEGYYATDAKRVEECALPCPAGSYCPVGATEPTQCGSPTFYCPALSRSPIRVTDGYYTTGGDANTRTGQQPCGAGFFCANGVASPCENPATYCPGTTDSALPVSTGWYSTPVTGARTGQAPCPEGYYCSQGVLQECGSVGFYCPAESASRSAVGPGYYSVPVDGSVANRTGQAQCGPGTYCSGGVRYPCPAGSYGSEAGLADSRCSGPCEAGYLCAEGSTRQDPAPCGGAHVYCPAGSSGALSVPSGSYSEPLDSPAETRFSIRLCDPGYWCDAGVRHPCAAGRYASASGKEEECQDLCLAGFYCPAGTSIPQVCGSPDKYCPEGSSEPLDVGAGNYSTGGSGPTQRTGRTPCPPGYACNGGVRAECGSPDKYCPVMSHTPLDVPAGHYSVGDTPTTAYTFEECQPGSYCAFGVSNQCPGGVFGDRVKLNSSLCSGRCEAGYYCPPGSLSPTASECGAINKFCTSGSAGPTAVSQGFYTVPLAALATRRSGEIECPGGSFCAAGVRHLCPPGRFGSISGLETLDAACTVCPAGVRCPNSGSLRSDQLPCGTDASVYCPTNSTAATVVPPGYFSKPEDDDITHRQTVQPCPQGYWCQDGVRTPCASGRYGSEQGLNTSDCSGLCEPGFWCQAASTSSKGLGTSPDDPLDVRSAPVACPPGSYCPGTGPDKVVCPVGRFNEREHATSLDNCTLCDAGTYQPSVGRSLRTHCLACPGEEDSEPGSESCWPALLAVTAYQNSIPKAGIGSKDYLELVFSKPTNQVDLTVDNIADFLFVSTPLADTLVATWLTPQQLQVRLEGVNRGVGGVDIEASAIGTLMVGVNLNSGLRDAAETSGEFRGEPLYVNGSWGIATQPEITSITAINTGNLEGLNDGDTLRIRLDQAAAVSDISVANASDILKVIDLHPMPFLEAVGSWFTPDTLVYTDLIIVMTRVDPTVSRDSTWFDALRVTMLAEADIRSIDGESPPANATAYLTEGSWGEPPCRVRVRVHSWTSLLVDVAAPPHADRFPPSMPQVFSVLVSNSSDFSSGVTSIMQASTPILVPSLTPDVPVYIRAAATNADGNMGPYLQYAARGELVVDGGLVECDACTRCDCVSHYSELRDVASGYTEPHCVTVTPALPEVLRVDLTGENLATAGDQRISARGYNLGVPEWNEPGYVQLSYSNSRFAFNATGCQLLPDSDDGNDAAPPLQSMSCTSSPGVGADHAVQVRVGTGYSAPSDNPDTILSYEPPVISFFSSNGTVAGTPGHEEVLVHGKQFGRVEDDAVDGVLYAPSSESNITFVAMDCTLVEDHVLIRCLTAPGAGSRLDWAVNVAGQTSTTPFTSYRGPVVTGLEAVVSPDLAVPPPVDLGRFSTAGGQLVDIVGTDFGESIELVRDVSYLSSNTQRSLQGVDCVMVAPHTRIRCATAPGIGRDYEWSITVLDQTSPVLATHLMSYEPPTVTSAECSSTCVDGNVTSIGGTVRLTGNGFGPAELAADVKAFVNEVAVRLVTITTDHTEMEFQAAGFGAATTLQLRVSVAGQETSASVHVSPPYISPNGLKGDFESEFSGPLPPELASAAFAPFLLIVNGESFGDNSADVTVVIRATGTDELFPCVVPTILEAHRELSCWTVFREAGTVIVTVRGQTSFGPGSGFVFDDINAPPTITAIDSDALTTQGGTIELQGTGFAVGESSVVVNIVEPGPVPEGAENDATTVLLNARSVVPCTNPSVGGQPPAETIVCTVPAGVGAGYRVSVKAGGLTGVSPADVTMRYPLPTIATVTPNQGRTAGGQSSVLVGTNFGPPNNGDVEVLVADHAGVIVAQNHTVIEWITPEGVSGQFGAQVFVNVSGQLNEPLHNDDTGLVSTPADRFVYGPPAVSPSFTLHDVSPTEGGGSISLEGDNFGPPGSLSVVFTDGEDLTFECQVVWNTHIAALCTMDPGYGVQLILVLNNGGREQSDNGVTFSYLPPTLYSVFDYDSLGPGTGDTLYENTEDSRPATGGFKIHVTGSSFSPQPKVLIGDPSDGLDSMTLCVPDSVSHTSVICEAPARPVIGNQLVVQALTHLGSETYRSVLPVSFPYDPPEVREVLNSDDEMSISANSATRLRLDGQNFGPADVSGRYSRAIHLNGVPCAISDFTRDTSAVCVTPDKMEVGIKNLTVVLGGVEESNPVFIPAACDPGFYGLKGENCSACPEAATCLGGDAHPTANEGFFRISRSQFVPCEPVEACPAGSGYAITTSGAVAEEAPTCSRGYGGERCSECLNGFYRLEASCEKCPDAAWVFIVIFFVVIGVIVLLAYWINKKQINLAGITIGIDFAQVVAMFAAFDFNWPVELQDSMNTVSAANFNLQVLAPECTATFAFQDKWAVIQTIPLAALFLLGVVAGGVHGLHKYRTWQATSAKGRKRLQRTRSSIGRDLNQDLSALMGAFFTMLYYMYLQLVRNTLTVFDCTSSLDENGKETSVLDIEPAIVCSGSDPVYVVLFPLAVISVIFYVIGIPLLFSFVLYHWRVEIRGDQTLRLTPDEGKTAATNPYLSVRKRFQKLYNDFRPGCFYWRLVLMARKCGLAFVAIMFDKHPMFQASVSILIMNVSYAVHVHMNPFRTSTQVPDEVRDAIKAKAAARKRGSVSAASAAYKVTSKYAALVKTNSLTYVFDYNRLETTLLISSTLMLIGGMVFAAGTMEEEDPLIEDKSWQYYILTSFLIILLFASLIGFIGIITWEVYRSLQFARVLRMGQLHSKKLARIQNPMRALNAGPGAGGGAGMRSSTTATPTVPATVSKVRLGSSPHRAARVRRLSDDNAPGPSNLRIGSVASSTTASAASTAAASTTTASSPGGTGLFTQQSVRSMAPELAPAMESDAASLPGEVFPVVTGNPMARLESKAHPPDGATTDMASAPARSLSPIPEARPHNTTPST